MKNKNSKQPIRSFRLSDELTARVRAIGNGDFSAAVKEAIELLIEKHRATVK